MAVLNESKENFLDMPTYGEDNSLQEERKVTGRYLAVGLVLFLVVLGLYHAVSYGSTKMSALFGAALIMFLYLLWLLYASHRRKAMLKKTEKLLDQQVSEVMVSLNNLKNEGRTSLSRENIAYVENETLPSPASVRKEENCEEKSLKNDVEFKRTIVFNRQYSIA